MEPRQVPQTVCGHKTADVRIGSEAENLRPHKISALPLKADVRLPRRHVRNGPEAEKANAGAAGRLTRRPLFFWS